MEDPRKQKIFIKVQRELKAYIFVRMPRMSSSCHFNNGTTKAPDINRKTVPFVIHYDLHILQ
jgi:hypothetical protein